MCSRTWVGLTLILVFHPSCPVVKTLLPNSHQPRQNWADSGTLKIQVNPTQVHEHMGRPVQTTPIAHRTQSNFTSLDVGELIADPRSASAISSSYCPLATRQSASHSGLGGASFDFIFLVKYFFIKVFETNNSKGSCS